PPARAAACPWRRRRPRWRASCGPPASTGASRSTRTWTAPWAEFDPTPSRTSFGWRVRVRAMDVNGSAAIISGGASGLGEATARELARAGSTVVIADLNEERGKSVADELG